jgi:hypothetical protein
MCGCAGCVHPGGGQELVSIVPSNSRSCAPCAPMLSSVSRFKISTYGLGDGLLTVGEQVRISQPLREEPERLRNISIPFDSNRMWPALAILRHRGASGD